MRAIVITNDFVLLSFVQALLKDAGIAFAVLDGYASALKGGAGMTQQRVAISPADFSRARRVLIEAGLEKWVVDDEIA